MRSKFLVFYVRQGELRSDVFNFSNACVRLGHVMNLLLEELESEGSLMNH